MLRMLLASLLFFTSALAQNFIFVSSRTQIEGDLSLAESWQRNQNELFIYRNGSEIRFTKTNGLSEYDPVISPDGNLVAYTATSWVYPKRLEDSAWQIIVKDLRGRTVAETNIANSQESMRPAGGWILAWTADSSGFYFNQMKANSYDWDVYFFDLKTKTVKRITEGFMPILSPDNKLLAGNVDGVVRVYDIDLDESWPVFEGNALAWYSETNLFVQDGRSLWLVDVYDSDTPNLIHDFAENYIQVVMNENGEYAFFVRNEMGSSLYKFIKRNELLSKYFDGFIREISLQDDGSIIYSLEEGNSIKIYKITEDGNITGLVNSFGIDYSPTLIKK